MGMTAPGGWFRSCLLQNMLQKQQQTLQMMSDISKMSHDSAMSVIRKLAG